jgi:WD40 repeat protein
MSTLPLSFALTGSLALASLTLARGEPPAKEGRPRADRLGDPLPEGAVARLGTTRFRLLEQGEWCLGFSTDGKALIFRERYGQEVLFRDLGTYGIVRRLRLAPDTYVQYARSADSRHLVCRREGDVTLIDLTTGKEVALILGKEIFKGNAPPHSSYISSRDGRLLAVSGEEDEGSHLICWLDTTTGKRLHRVRSQKGASFTSLAFTCDGKALAAVEAERQPGGKTWLRIWNVASGKLIPAGPLPQDARLDGLLAFLPDGKVLLGSHGWGLLLLCDPATGQTLRAFPEKGDGMASFTLSRDGKTLFGSARGRIRVWDVGTGKVVRELRLDSHPTEAPYIHLSHDGKTLAALGQHQLTLWDVRTGKQLYPTDGHTREVSSLAFSPAGDRLLSAGIAPAALFWDVASGKELARLMPAVPRPLDDRVVLSANNSNDWLRFSYPGAQALFAPDGKSVAAVWPDLPVHIWRADTGKLLHTLGQKKAHQALAFAADGRQLAAADQDGEIRLWNPASGKELDALRLDAPRTAEQGGIKAPTAVAASSDGKSVAAARLVFERSTLRMKIRQWEAVSRVERCCLEQAAGSRLAHHWGMQMSALSTSDSFALCLRFSPNGRLLALGDGNLIYLWDLASGKEVRQFAGPEVFACTLAFSPDGKLLAAGRLDGRIRLWRVDTGVVLRDLPAHDRAVTALAFSPDGRLLASGSRDTTILLWAVPEVAREAPVP